MTSFLQYCVNTLGYLRLMTVSDLIDLSLIHISEPTRPY